MSCSSMYVGISILLGLAEARRLSHARRTGLPVTRGLELSPAAGAVDLDDRSEHREERRLVDRLALVDRDLPSGQVAMAGGDDPVRIRGHPAVVQEYVDVVPRGQQRGDVAIEHEV